MSATVWIQAIRPKTLVATLSPVILGAVLALKAGKCDFVALIFTLLAALTIQIGTNLANDYFDFIKGSDTSSRKGPLRVTQAGLVSPQIMKRVVFSCFALAGVLSSYLVIRGGVTMAILSFISIFLGLAYTAGPFPLAYLGLGDLFVFFFFGPIATSATYFLQTQALTLQSILSGIGPGLLSTAILTINNLRDIDEDRAANKKTLCVRFGKNFGQWEYFFTVVLAGILPCFWGSYVQTLILIPALPILRTVFKAEGTEWNLLLGKTAQLLWVYTGMVVLEKMIAFY